MHLKHMKNLIGIVVCFVLAPGLLARATASSQAPQTQAPPPAATPADKPATIAGKWNGTVDAGQGPMDLQLELKLDGKKVSGTLTGQQGTMAVDGEFADNKLTFSISLDTAQGPFTVVFTATLKDDVFTGTADAGQMGSFPFRAERAKDK